MLNYHTIVKSCILYYFRYFLGITLGASDEADGGFVVTDVTTNGALYRTLHSVSDYRDVRFGLGDVVTELNGKSLRGTTLFGVQSLLWDLFSVEGNVRLIPLNTTHIILIDIIDLWWI